MNEGKGLTAIQRGLTAHIDTIGPHTVVELEGLGELATPVRLRLKGWEAIHNLQALCDLALTDIRAECGHTSHDDMVGLGFCEWCGMGDLEVEAQHKEEVELDG